MKGNPVNIIIRDFNVKIGTGTEACVGKFRMGRRNERGDGLVNYALARDFNIMNSLYKKVLQENGLGEIQTMKF